MFNSIFQLRGAVVASALLHLSAGAANAPACPANAEQAQLVNFVKGASIRMVANHGALHRFFDTSPISPSGRYLALTRFEHEERSVAPGDRAFIVLVDLKTGAERQLATTRGFELQLGAQLQWGSDDRHLFFNDVDVASWTPFTVQLDPRTGRRRRIDGPLFMVSPDGRYLAGHNLATVRNAQIGYGVTVPDSAAPHRLGLDVPEHGVYVTDVRTGMTRIVATPRQIVAGAALGIEEPDQQEFYVFQTKWNPQGTRLLVSFQWARPGRARRRAVITMRPDGSDMRVVVTPDQWARGGHHMNWTPDGRHVTMNLNVNADPALELVSVRDDGKDMTVLFAPGSGHPSTHPQGLPLMITDAYPGEPVTKGNGVVPIRLINTATRTEELVAEIFVSQTGGEFRVDPHPAWDRSGRYVVINGFVGCTRNVWLIDLREQVARAALNLRAPR